MRAYRIEIFNQNMEYRSSAQLPELKFTFDYLDIEKNKISLVKIIAEKGDYIRIQKGEIEYSGIISDVVIKKGKTEITFKPLHKIFDIKILADPEKLKQMSMEEWIKKIVEDLFINNIDVLQNIKGLTVNTLSQTQSTVEWEKGIKNMHEIIIDAFIKNGILCEFLMDIQNKKIILKIGKSTEKKFVIEADRKNILEKEITIKEAKESVNKLTIYNEADFTQCIIYYKDINDRVTKDNKDRVVPVVQECVSVKVSGTKTFEEVAKTKAEATLKASKYDNLIEITTLNEDSLVRPQERKIGQEAVIVSNGIAYQTILTGIEIDDQTKLIFGAIRLELTKLIKRRWKNDGY